MLIRLVLTCGKDRRSIGYLSDIMPMRQTRVDKMMVFMLLELLVFSVCLVLVFCDQNVSVSSSYICATFSEYLPVFVLFIRRNLPCGNNLYSGNTPFVAMFLIVARRNSSSIPQAPKYLTVHKYGVGIDVQYG